MASAQQDEKTKSSFGMSVIIKSLKYKWPSVPNMTTAELEMKIKSGILVEENSRHCEEVNQNLIILDSRPEEEYEVSHIKGAHRVSPDCEDISDTIDIVKTGRTSNIEVVCYCSLGYRSTNYADSLLRHLKTENQELLKKIRIYNLEGSLFKWANESRHMVDINGQQTICAHPYNAILGKLLNQELRKTTV